MMINLKGVSLFRLFNFFALILGISAVLFTPLHQLNTPTAEVKAAIINHFSIPVFDGTPISTVSAQAFYVYDPSSQTILLEKNSEQKMHPASLTKLMTALVALDLYHTDQIMTVKSASESIGSKVSLINGDQLTVEDLLFASLVSSGNDAALTLAENYPEGYSRFVDRMNQKARELGLKDTHFTNVSGLEFTDHKSTARDLTVLASHVVSDPLLSRIVSTKANDLVSLSGQRYQLYTTNELLGEKGVVGVKTGTTENSGQNLIVQSQQDGHSVIITILNSADRFADARILIDWVFAHFTWKQV